MRARVSRGMLLRGRQGLFGAMGRDGQLDRAVEQRRERSIVARENQGRVLSLALLKQELEERGTSIGIQRRRGLVGKHQLRRAYQRSRGGDALLLSNAELGHPTVQ